MLTEKYNLHPAWGQVSSCLCCSSSPFLPTTNPCSADIWMISANQRAWKPCWWNTILLLGGHRPLSTFPRWCLPLEPAKCKLLVDSLLLDLDAKSKCKIHWPGQSPFFPPYIYPLYCSHKKQFTPWGCPKSNIVPAEQKSDTNGC